MDMKNIKKESKYLGQIAKTTTEEITMALRDKQGTFLENLEKTESEQSVLVQKTLDEYLEVKIKMERDIQILKNSEKLHRSGLFLELKRMDKTVSKCHVKLDNLKKNYQTPILDVKIAFSEINVKEFYQLKLSLPVFKKSLHVEGSLCLY